MKRHSLIVSLGLSIVCSTFVKADDSTTALLNLIDKWKADHKSGITVATTEATSGAEAVTIYSSEQKGYHEFRADVNITRPIAVRYTVYNDAQSNIYAYFPKSNQVIRLSNAAQISEIKKSLGVSGDATSIKNMLLLTKADGISIKKTDSGFELKFDLDPQKLLEKGMAPAGFSSEVDTYTCLPTGEITKISKVINGSPVEIDLSSKSVQGDQIMTSAPSLPDPSIQVSNKTVQQAMKDELAQK